MKQFIILLFVIFLMGTLSAQNPAKSDQHPPPNVVIRLEGSVQNGWNKNDTESVSKTNIQTAGNDNVSFNTTSEGIYISIIKGPNKIKLFALTGQLLLNGDLSQGRFFIPTRKGIYFLRINTNSYKIICK